MLCRYCVLLSVLATVLNVQAGGSAQSRSGSRSDAHSEQHTQGQTRGDAQRQTAPADGRAAQESAALLAEQLQKRRDVLRQATQVQLQENPGPTRQWTAQERAELRQQLQQQRLELLK